jgi:hypothetical protein
MSAMIKAMTINNLPTLKIKSCRWKGYLNAKLAASRYKWKPTNSMLKKS